MVSLLVSLLAMQSAATGTLYEDLGGQPGVEAIVERMLEVALTDERIGFTFDESNIERVEEKLILQFCELSGGPCVYDGLSMAESHGPLDLNSAHFNALVEALQTAMRENDVSFRAQNRFLAILAPMKRDVVTR